MGKPTASQISAGSSLDCSLNVARIAGIPSNVYSEAYEKAKELERTTQDRQIANSSKRLLDALQADNVVDEATSTGDVLLHMLDGLGDE